MLCLAPRRSPTPRAYLPQKGRTTTAADLLSRLEFNAHDATAELTHQLRTAGKRTRPCATLMLPATEDRVPAGAEGVAPNHSSGSRCTEPCLACAVSPALEGLRGAVRDAILRSADFR